VDDIAGPHRPTRNTPDTHIVKEPATLATESGVTVFRVAFARWVAPAGDASLTDLIEVVAELRAVTSAPGLPPDLGHC
jgi:hypothetical protein